MYSVTSFLNFLRVKLFLYPYSTKTSIMHMVEKNLKKKKKRIKIYDHLAKKKSY